MPGIGAALPPPGLAPDDGNSCGKFQNVRGDSSEKEVVELASAGLRNREIGRVLGISEQTVHGHLRNIFEKLNVTDRMAAVRVAVSSWNHSRVVDR